MNTKLIKAESSWLIKFLWSVVLRHPILFRRTVGGWKEKPEGMEDPKPDYKIPKDLLEKARAGELKVNNSTEKYLRPVKGCESTAPEIVALAHELGAYKLSDWDYANKVFKWVKNHIKWHIGQGGAVDILKLGRGFCTQKTNLFIALCRAGALKARCRVMPSIQLDSRMQGLDMTIAPAFGMNPIYAAINNTLIGWPISSLAEVQIDDKWIAAEPTFQDEWEAALDLPVLRFGEEPVESLAKAFGQVSNTEDPPRFGRTLLKFLSSMPGFLHEFDKLSDSYIKRGKEIIDEAGGSQAYNESMKRGYGGLGGELEDIMKKIE